MVRWIDGAVAAPKKLDHNARLKTMKTGASSGVGRRSDWATIDISLLVYDAEW